MQENLERVVRATWNEAVSKELSSIQAQSSIETQTEAPTEKTRQPNTERVSVEDKYEAEERHKPKGRKIARRSE